jgi:hypothetical protein
MRSRLFSCLPFLLLLLCGPLAAQEGANPAAIHHRNQCRLAAQVLETGHPHPKYPWALNYIMICEEQAPPVLVQMWRRQLTDTLEVRHVMTASSRIRDRRIYEEVRRVALDRAKPDVMRVGALIVLSEYVDTGMAYSFPDLAPPPGEIRRLPSRWTSGTHGFQTTGPEPLPESVDAPVIQLYEQLAQDQSNRPVWFAAAVLARNVRRWVEHPARGHAPLPAP